MVVAYSLIIIAASKIMEQGVMTVGSMPHPSFHDVFEHQELMFDQSPTPSMPQAMLKATPPLAHPTPLDTKETSVIANGWPQQAVVTTI